MMLFPAVPVNFRIFLLFLKHDIFFLLLASKGLAAPPPPPYIININQAVPSQTSAGFQSVENISPAITSDSLPKTPSTMPANKVPPVPSPLVQPTVPYVNPVLPHTAYLGSTFSPVPFGIPPPTDSTLPVSSNASTLLPPPNRGPQSTLVGVQNTPGFGQAFAHVPPIPPSFMKTQPPPSHIQSLPTHSISAQLPPSHMHSQPPPSHMQSHIPPPSLIPGQPPPETHQPQSGQTYSQRPPLPPHALYPSMHHQHATQQPPPMSMMPRAGMNNVGPPTVSASNPPNWHASGYSRPPPNTRPMGRGGWMR
jgi:hypothetical protein